MLVSGGLDSAVLLAEMAERYRRVWPIYIRQGLAWEAAELYWLKRFLLYLRPAVIPAKAGTQSNIPLGPRHCTSGGGDGIQALTVLSLPMNDVYGAHWSTGHRAVPGARSRDSAVYLPGRNMILSVKAAVFASMRGIPVLAIGSLDHNPFPDAAPAFFRRWGAALSAGLGAQIKVIAPYRRLSKVEVIVRGRDWPLELSFSCIAPRGRLHYRIECGKQPAGKSRRYSSEARSA